MDTDLTFDEMLAAMTELVETTSFTDPLPEDAADPDPYPEDDQPMTTVKEAQTFFPK